MKQEEQHPWSITVSSLLCQQSAPSFICSLSGWEEPLLKLQICDSSWHNPGIHRVLAAVPQPDTVHWKTSIWRHDQCSPDASKSTSVLTEVGQDHFGELYYVLAALKQRSQFDFPRGKQCGWISAACNMDNMIISTTTRYRVMEKLRATKDHFSVIFFFTSKGLFTHKCKN